MSTRRSLCLFLCIGAALAASHASAGQTRVAVAANFADAARDIAAAFAQSSGHKAVLSFASSGQLFAQITQAAPFEILLSADAERPRDLIALGLAIADTRMTYAVGKLALWSRDARLVQGAETLRAAAFTKIAIASPKAAPYGGAAIETMQALGVFEKLKARIVEGASIAQAHQFVETGNAELGFVALSQLVGQSVGSRWIVGDKLHAPILQDAVLLRAGAANEAAQAFMAFLKQPAARAIVARYGYGGDAPQ